jgi:hypothetical protein
MPMAGVAPKMLFDPRDHRVLTRDLCAMGATSEQGRHCQGLVNRSRQAPAPALRLALPVHADPSTGSSPTMMGRGPAPSQDSPTRVTRVRARSVATTVPQLSHFRGYSGRCSAERDIAYQTK